MQHYSEEALWARFAAVTSGSFPLVSSPLESGGKKRVCFKTLDKIR